MNQNILIITIVVLVVVGVGAYMMFGKKDNFDITVDPTPSYTYVPDSDARAKPYQYKRVTFDCSNPSRVRGNGLIMSDDGMDIETFTKKVGDKIQDTALVPMYCSNMYENYNQYFSERWESLGVCEQEISNEIAEKKQQ